MKVTRKKYFVGITASGLRSYWLGLLLVGILIALAAPSQATTADFVWINGNRDPAMGNSYGTKGVPSSTNHPGTRESSFNWKTPDGMLWMYGGYDNSFNGGAKSDLWKYDPASSLWTWVAGDMGNNGQGPNYGIKGVPSPANTPGPRYSGCSWTGTDGSLWLFGGQYETNDMWKFDPGSAQWTWMGGSGLSSQPGVYGTKGVASPDNIPGGRSGAAFCTGSDGTFWLFGGLAYFDELWKYNQASGEWTWVSGDQGNHLSWGEYGTKGIAAATNMPGSRENALLWTDHDGKVWLFGGHFQDYTFTTYLLNDMWQFDPTNGLWTWYAGDELSYSAPARYGTQGEYGPDNTPTYNYNVNAWTDLEGHLRLFNGELWSFDTALKQWAWLKGASPSSADFGTQGQPSDSNTPGTQQGAMVWPGNDGLLWLFGGSNLVNVLWNLDPASNQWTWVSGSKIADGIGHYGTQGTAASDNLPPGRSSSANWTDANGILWMFGGRVSNGNVVNDLWKFDPATKLWTWVGGSQTPGQRGTYGTIGVPAPENIPDARSGAATWIGQDGNFWLFGGNSPSGLYNDLWKFNPVSEQWTWMAGSNVLNQGGYYGTKGIPTNSTVPGSRYGAVTWVGTDGSLWMFGGRSYIMYNDLWKFDPGTFRWTWISGDNYVDTSIYPDGLYGSYGQKGVSDPANIPGGRMDSASWVGPDGSLWMFGGRGNALRFVSGDLNDMWKFDLNTSQWTWVAGTQNHNASATYSAPGVYAPENNPLGMSKALSWSGDDGGFWLLGGDAQRNDLWKFNPSLGQWALIKGHNYLAQGTNPETGSDIPLGTSGGANWVDNSGNFWFFAGDPNNLWEIRMRFTSAVDDWRKLWGSMD